MGPMWSRLPLNWTIIHLKLWSFSLRKGVKVNPVEFIIRSECLLKMKMETNLNPIKGNPNCWLIFEFQLVVLILLFFRQTVEMAIRKIEVAPGGKGRQPSCIIRKDFLLSPGELELEATLDKPLYYHGENLNVNLSISNYSNKSVKKIVLLGKLIYYSNCC